MPKFAALSAKTEEEKWKIERLLYQFETGKPSKSVFAMAAEMVMSGVDSIQIGMLLRDKLNKRLDQLDDSPYNRNKLSGTENATVFLWLMR